MFYSQSNKAITNRAYARHRIRTHPPRLILEWYPTFSIGCAIAGKRLLTSYVQDQQNVDPCHQCTRRVLHTEYMYSRWLRKAGLPHLDSQHQSRRFL